MTEKICHQTMTLSN